MGTGLIYGAIVAVWAAFLVPWALRRYDEAAHTRSIEKFSTAMRVLGRRDAGEPATLAAPRGLAESEREPAPVPPSAGRPTRAAARVAARRRRRTLLVLLALTAVVLLLGAVGVLPLWAVAAPLALVGAFLAACRRQVAREDEALWTQASPARPAVPQRQPSGASAVRRAARVDSAYGGQRPAAGDEPNDEPTVVLSPGALVEAEAVAVPVTTDDGTSLWDPLPVTLPTYVTKARAGRTIRTIDLGEPGTWTSGHVEGEQTVMPEPEPVSAEASGDSAQQRAVGS